MVSTKHIIAAAAFISISACGGGGGSAGNVATAPPTATTQSVGGVWTTQYTVTSGANAGDVINAQGIVSENGQYFLYSKNTNNGCAGLGFGQLSVSGSTVSGDEDFATVQYSTVPGVTTNCVYPDGSKSGTGTVDGSVTQRQSLTVTGTGTTSLGTVLPSETTTWSFSSLYMNPSSLATIAGNYNDGGPTLSIDANGVIFEQDPNGCIINGQISIIDASYNAYGIRVTFANCTGTSASLNGFTATGLAVLDTNTNPITIVAGLSGNVGGNFFATAIEIPKL
jgi:hypothetical protein